MNDEVTLLERVRQGDRPSFNLFYLRHYPQVLTFVKAIVKDDVLAEDATQNLFIRLWLHRKQLPQADAMDRYLFVSSKNMALNMLRQEFRYRFAEEVAETSATGNTTEEDVELMELSDRINRALADLPERQRQVFVMSRFEGRSNAEIARGLGISVRTVETHITAALQKLRKLRLGALFLIINLY